jgi:hypothetical protein
MINLGITRGGDDFHFCRSIKAGERIRIRVRVRFGLGLGALHEMELSRCLWGCCLWLAALFWSRQGLADL